MKCGCDATYTKVWKQTSEEAGSRHKALMKAVSRAVMVVMFSQVSGCNRSCEEEIAAMETRHGLSREREHCAQGMSINDQSSRMEFTATCRTVSCFANAVAGRILSQAVSYWIHSPSSRR